MSAPDALALTMVAVLAFALGSIATMFLIMDRNARRNLDRLELPEDEEEESPRTKATSAGANEAPAPEAWEKEADWWKK